jgi:hypothetical protein
MTYQFLSGTYNYGYALSPSYSGLVVEKTAVIFGTGVSASSYAVVENSGYISGRETGIALNAGGYVDNGSYASIVGATFGVEIDGYANAKVTNYGAIRAGVDGVFLGYGGTVINGSQKYHTASILSVNVGIYSKNLTAVTNFGTIRGSFGDGVNLKYGGGLINGSYADTAALVEGGSSGVYISTSAGAVINFGTIRGSYGNGVMLNHGGGVTNGSILDTGARIEGFTGVGANVQSATIANFGTIVGTGSGGDGIFLPSGGTVTNGATNDTAAAIQGSNSGVHTLTAATINNFGSIVGAIYDGIYVKGGGSVTNGSVTDTKASIDGAYGVTVLGGAATVTNFGAIMGSGAGHGFFGVQIGAGGTLTNGAATRTGALIEGYSGVLVLGAAGTVVNYGTLKGDGVAAGEAGLFLAAGGSVTNGGGGDRSALIEGAGGVGLGAAGTVANFGTIVGATRYGVQLDAGGRVTNGSLNNADALIEGHNGLFLTGPATAVNFGTVIGTGDFAGAGASLAGGVSLTNGAAGHGKASLEGYIGVSASGAANTVTNFGTINGAGGTAVAFNKSSDVLAVEAGCAFVGQVLGGGGTLDLDTGTGTLTGLLAGGSVTVSGSMAATAFQSFDTVEIGAAATFATSGAVTIGAGQRVIGAGRLALGASKSSLANAGIIETLGGTVTVRGKVTGSGQAIINGGLLDFVSAFDQNVTFARTTGVLELARSQTYTATVSGFSKTGGTSLDLADIGFVSAGEATFSGTKTGGVLTVTDGTHTAHIALVGNYLASTFIAASDGHGGVIIHDPPKLAAAAPHAFIAAMAGMGAGGAGLEWGATGGSHAPPALARPRSQAA